MMKGSIVSLTPPSSDAALRKASTSVISASSFWVTCGMLTQERCRCAADILRMRDRGLVSISPNLEKSTAGIGGIPLPPVAAAGAAGALSERFTNACSSSITMRPRGPLPLTLARSTPSWRANLRVAGPAYTTTPGAVAEGAGSGATSVTGTAAAGVFASVFGGGVDVAVGTSTGAATPPVVSSSQTSSPCDTLSLALSLKRRTTPAAGDGTSIVALSLSSTISGASFPTLSPSLTSTSITGTSL